MTTNTPNIIDDIWQTCLLRIKEQTSADEFTKWFQPIVPIGFDGKTKVLRLKVPNESYVCQIEKNYIPFLKPIIHQYYGVETSVRYAIPMAEQAKHQTQVAIHSDTTAINKHVNQTNTTNIQNAFAIPGLNKRKILFDPQLNPHYTFDTFIEGECNRLGRSAGLSIAVDPGATPFNPLFIYGDSGLGKTHLVHAIGNEVVQRNPQLQVLYISMSKFQAQYQNASLKGELNDFMHFYQMIDVLMIDDIHEIAGKTKTQNAFFNIFNHLQLAGKQIIITSDKSPVELEGIEERLITRFKWGLSTQLIQPDTETKTRIINTKVKKMNTEIPGEVVDFLATNINENIREIEGALTSLVANASFMNKKISVNLAKEILKVYVSFHQKEVTIDMIKAVVSKQLNIDISSFNSPKRTREVAQARQIAMYLSKQHTKHPLSAIGAAIGGKNHATVLHACKTIANLMDTDKIFSQLIKDIEKQLAAK
ncbi:MAG: chromosomal replication initiator protein DnaA [Rikenellaceae bacterium]